MPAIVDDLFVEIHYKHITMSRFQLELGPPRETANALFQKLRTQRLLRPPLALSSSHPLALSSPHPRGLSSPHPWP